MSAGGGRNEEQGEMKTEYRYWYELVRLSTNIMALLLDLGRHQQSGEGIFCIFTFDSQILHILSIVYIFYQNISQSSKKDLLFFFAYFACYLAYYFASFAYYVLLHIMHIIHVVFTYSAYCFQLFCILVHINLHINND